MTACPLHVEVWVTDKVSCDETDTCKQTIWASSKGCKLSCAANLLQYMQLVNQHRCIELNQDDLCKGLPSPREIAAGRVQQEIIPASSCPAPFSWLTVMGGRTGVAGNAFSSHAFLHKPGLHCLLYGDQLCLTTIQLWQHLSTQTQRSPLYNNCIITVASQLTQLHFIANALCNHIAELSCIRSHNSNQARWSRSEHYCSRGQGASQEGWQASQEEKAL